MSATLHRPPPQARFDAIDPTRRYASVRVVATRGDGEPLGAGAAERIRIVLAAEVLGVCQRALEMTLEYVKDRKQFGVPVGSFQAVAHRCAQMLFTPRACARPSTTRPGRRRPNPTGCRRRPRSPRRRGRRAAKEVTASAIQAHGGIGFTWEADVHWLYKRAQLDVALLGGARRHRAALARLAAARVTAVPALG